MKIDIMIEAPRWTIKNAEKWIDWLEKELVSQDARIKDAYANGKNLMRIKKYFKS